MIRSLIRRLGFELRRIRPSETRKSQRTRDLTLHETSTGKYYLPTHAYEDIVANAIMSNQIFDSEIVNLAKNYIQEGTVVLDVGANLGQMSVLFAQLVGNNGKVYSFEADDWIYEILSKNIEINGLNNVVKPIFGAVHNCDNEILVFPVQDFQEHGTYGSYGIDYNAKSGREVKSITIDSLKIEEPISFMKVDIQGGDLQAMQGAVKTIERNRMPIIFEYEYRFEDKLDLKFQDYVNFVHTIEYKFEKVIDGQNYLIIPR